MPSTRSNKNSENKIGEYNLMGQPILEQPGRILYVAKEAKGDKQRFLLTLSPESLKTGDMAERFLRRAKTLAQVKHDSILPIINQGMDGKRPFVVMPFVPGQFLADFLQTAARPRPEVKSEIVASLKLVGHIAAGLSAAHPTGLLHHDLRPENIYLAESGQPLLLDLVIPPALPASQNLQDPQTELDYASPEQLAGKALSGRSNVFSLGVLLYRLLAGRKPALPVSEWDIFEHKGVVREEPLQKVRPDLTKETYKAVQDCIWQKEWSRFETVDALCRAIDRAISAESAPPIPPPPLWQNILNKARQPKTLKILLPIIGVLLILLLAMLMFLGQANRQQNEIPTQAPSVSAPEGDTAVITDTENAVSNPPTVLPSATVSEAELAAETTTPTIQPSPPNTAETPTATTLPQTDTPTATAQTTNTPTPSLEPTATSCIPSPPSGWVRYEIQANDSLSRLSQATGITVERLIEVNCLDTILLSIGQGLWLPGLPAEPATPTPEET